MNEEPPEFATVRLPFSKIVAEERTVVFVNGECWALMKVELPEARKRLLLIVKVGLPGASSPPELIVTAAPEIEPMPPSRPPLFTTTGEPLKLPFNTSAPLLTVVVPVCVLSPVNVHVPSPSLISATMPWKDAALVASVSNPPTRKVTAFFPPAPLPPSAPTIELEALENSPMG